MKRARPIVFVAAFLGGCAKEPPKRIDRAPEPSISASRNDAPAVDWTIVPGVAVGPIAIGQERSSVIATLGEPEAWGTSYGKAYAEYRSIGLGVAFVRDHVDSLVAHTGVEGGYEAAGWSPYLGETRDHVGVGATYERILALYGAPLDTGKRPSAPVASLWIRYPGVQFELTDPAHALVSITVFADKK